MNHQYELFAAVILAYCAAHQPVDPAKGEAFFKTLDKEAFKDPGQLLKKIDAVSQRMWTSALTLEDCGPEHERELCFLINHAIRQDHPALVAPAVQLARNINQLCVTRRKKVPLLPPNGLCFRGSSLPDAHRSFFTPGKKYRAAGFLATSFKLSVAKRFIYNAHHGQGGVPVVLWRIHLDERGQDNFEFTCKHVNYVQNTNVAGEDEFLFVPYSVFTVRSVEWNKGDDRHPHVIELEAAVDNRDEPEDLPLAPWY